MEILFAGPSDPLSPHILLLQSLEDLERMPTSGNTPESAWFPGKDGIGSEERPATGFLGYPTCMGLATTLSAKQESETDYTKQEESAQDEDSNMLLRRAAFTIPKSLSAPASLEPAPLEPPVDRITIESAMELCFELENTPTTSECESGLKTGWLHCSGDGMSDATHYGATSSDSNQEEQVHSEKLEDTDVPLLSSEEDTYNESDILSDDSADSAYATEPDWPQDKQELRNFYGSGSQELNARSMPLGAKRKRSSQPRSTKKERHNQQKQAPASDAMFLKESIQQEQKNIRKELEKLGFVIIPENGEFKCSICKSRFNTKQKARRHGTTHLGHNPYRCQFCGINFTRSDSRMRHVFKKHLLSQEK